MARYLRRNSKENDKTKKEKLERIIYSENEKLLGFAIKTCNEKGLGIQATKQFKKGIKYVFKKTVT